MHITLLLYLIEFNQLISEASRPIYWGGGLTPPTEKIHLLGARAELRCCPLDPDPIMLQLLLRQLGFHGEGRSARTVFGTRRVTLAL